MLEFRRRRIQQEEEALQLKEKELKAGRSVCTPCTPAASLSNSGAHFFLG